MKKKIIITAALALTLSAGVFAACDSETAVAPEDALINGSTVDAPLSSAESGEQAGYRLSFDSCGGSPVDAVNYPSHAYLVEPEPPTLEGYRFDGWYWDRFNRNGPRMFCGDCD